jgi:hypothetical protein
MSNWNLIGLFLDFDFLITEKFALFCLKIQMSLDLIFYTFNAWAFNLWSECPSENNLINFISTSVTSINCDLHAWFNITASCNYTFNGHQWTNWVWFYFSHFCDSFFWVLPIHNDYLILSLEFRGNLVGTLFRNQSSLFNVLFECCLLILLDFVLLVIEPSLLHQNIFRLEVWVLKGDGWRGH